MKLTVNIPDHSYDILIEHAALSKIGALLSLDRRVLIVTDTGVPKAYAEAVKRAAKQGVLVRLPRGEKTKSLAAFSKLLGIMLEHHFTRNDCVVAVGGGVIGDLAGFVASAYMRGVDFYNIPTTLLSMVDSSIGGKTAVNYGSFKNPIGAFYQPKRVVIDPDVLKTLPERQIASGLAECIKMALTSDKALFETIEKSTDISEDLDKIILASLTIKKSVVEKDEKEEGLRKILNFGHTLGHAIESENDSHGLYHGECIALGMLPMVSPSVRARLLPLFQKLSLPTDLVFDKERAFEALLHDKKSNADSVTAILVDEIGRYRMEKLSFADLKQRLSYFGGSQ